MSTRKSLSEILNGSKSAADLRRAWATTEAAGDLEPLPPGEYRVRVLSGELFESKSGTPGFKLTLEVVDGDFAGRKLWHDVWLTQAALPMAKRDLGKLGITELGQMERPLPGGILLGVKVATRQNDAGDTFNVVRSITAAGIEADPFAPSREDVDDDQDDGEAGDTTFDFGANEPKGPADLPGMGGDPARGPYGSGGDRR